MDGSRSRHLIAKMVTVMQTRAKESSAMEISTIGLDLAGPQATEGQQRFSNSRN
jgi:hypothetical protein